MGILSFVKTLLIPKLSHNIQSSNDSKTHTTMKKQFIYYGTEENFFEIEKHETNDVSTDVKSFIDEELGDYTEEERQEIVNDILEDVSRYGYGYYEDANEQGYYFFIGVAEEGKCARMRVMLNEKRDECMAMAGF